MYLLHNTVLHRLYYSDKVSSELCSQLPRSSQAADLDGSNISYLNLDGSNISYLNLEGSNISYLNLDGSNISYLNLDDSNISYLNKVMNAISCMSHWRLMSVICGLKFLAATVGENQGVNMCSVQCT